jgi:hypothetical protein
MAKPDRGGVRRDALAGLHRIAPQRSLCADVVEKAIERAGGRLRQSKFDGDYITFRSWDITVAGHPMSVQYTVIRTGNPRDVICSLASEHNEDDSISAIIKWVGTAPEQDTVNSAPKHTARKFRYQQQGDSRSPVPTAPT